MFKWIASQNFNAMRIPFHLDLVLNDAQPSSISYGYCQTNISCNMDLKGLSSLQVLDKMIATAGAYGIQIMLDMHSFEPDAYASNGLWYDSSHSEAVVLRGWDILIERYHNKSNVIAVDIKNEPFLGTWNTDNPSTDWDAACTRIGNHIASQTSWLVFVEGVASSPPCAQACFYGENLQGVKTAPVKLTASNRIVYSPHTYGPNVYPQLYFSDPTFPKNMPAIWDAHFGFITALNGPAVVAGEWGGPLSGASGVWLNAFVDYLVARNITDTFFWCLNPDSGDTGGLLGYDWVTPDQPKFDLLARLVPNPSKFTF